MPDLAYHLGTDVNGLFGNKHVTKNITIYEDEYRRQDYHWGTVPFRLCYRVLELMPPVRPLCLLDVCCGEGRNAVFFARNGYIVTAFDISESGVEKTKRLAESSNVGINTFRADVNDFRVDTAFDIIFSCGALHYIRPELRTDVVENYKAHTSKNGLAVLNAFIDKPFVGKAPENEPLSFYWKSGELITYYSDRLLHDAVESIFDCKYSGIPHRHCIKQMIAEKIVQFRQLLYNTLIKLGQCIS